MITSLLTFRYTFSKSNRNLSHSVRIIIGLALSTVVLLTVFSVMDFLQNEQFRTIKEVRSFPVSVLIDSSEKAQEILDELDEIADGFYYKESAGLLESGNSTQSIFIRYIDETYNPSGMTFLYEKNGLVAGPRLVNSFSGDEIYLSVLEQGKRAVRVLSREEVKLSGYYYSTLGTDFDQNYVFLPILSAPSTAKGYLALFPKEGLSEEDILSYLKDYDTLTWKEREGTLYNAMLIEKWIMLLLLSVLFLIILVQVYHNSKTLIRVKQKEIASLILLGVKESTINTVFFLSGAILCLVGVLIGTLLTVLLINLIPYIITLPFSLNITTPYLGAIILAFIMSILSGLLFLYQTKKVEKITLGDIIYERN